VTERRRIFRVGLTGGTGAGKTVVARYLVSWGALLIEGDVIGREVVEPGSDAWKALVNAFGQEILLPEGTLDRRKLAHLVFTDPAARAALDSIIHPPLLSRLHETIQRVEQHAGAHGRILVVDAALIFEWDILDWFDRILVVVASEESCVRRLIEDGLSEAEARGRIRSQLDPLEKARRAHEVIRNDGSLEELETAAREVWERFQQAARA